ncbi:Dirigent protein 21 [Camellia lanceoleosa]|uniref:Dirigent protein 21 n=1 Tax=Camellia lanceoleosa TaxID=1840588 RepID=A0ACC0IS83_9ERIC|nr:Dirigent protein 21 [Camellia lanceoleosa]
MEKLSAILILCSIMVISVPAIRGIAEDPKSVEKWFENLTHSKQKLTKLHFYFHDIESGNNITSIQVARAPNNNSTSAAAFGGINVFDNAMTVGPNVTSKQLGRAQGLFAASSLGPQSLLITMNLFFTEGEFNGSTLAIVGRDPILDQYREMSVVGGSGEFRLARGIATAKTFSFDTAANNAVVEYHVVVIHY